MRQTRLIGDTTRAFAGTTRETSFFLDGGHNGCDRNIASRFGEPVTAATAARTVDEIGAAQMDEKLLEIRQRQVLSFRNLRQRHGGWAIMAGEIRHRHHRVPPFGVQFHVETTPDWRRLKGLRNPNTCIQYPGLC